MKKWMGMVLFSGILFLQGCGMAVTETNLSQLHFVKQGTELGDRTQEERAAIIKRRLYQQETIGGCAVVVEGHTAIIGLRLREDMEQNRLRSVRKEVDIAAREADPDLESTSITMNPHIVSLIEEMERKRAGGTEDIAPKTF